MLQTHNLSDLSSSLKLADADVMTVGVADPIARVRDTARSSAAVVRLHSVRLRPLVVAAAAAAVVGVARVVVQYFLLHLFLMGLGIMGIPMVFMCKRIPRTLMQ